VRRAFAAEFDLAFEEAPADELAMFRSPLVA
jgi:hypothetical protein